MNENNVSSKTGADEVQRRIGCRLVLAGITSFHYNLGRRRKKKNKHDFSLVASGMRELQQTP